MYLRQALIPNLTETMDVALMLMGFGMFVYVLYKTYIKKEIGREFYFGMPAIAIYLMTLAIAGLTIPIEQFGLWGQVLYWTFHVIGIAALIPYIASAVVAFFAHVVGKLVGQDFFGR